MDMGARWSDSPGFDLLLSYELDDLVMSLSFPMYKIRTITVLKQ